MNNIEINNLWLSRTLELISSGYLVNIDSYADVLSAEKAMKIARGQSISAIGNKTFESSDGSTNFYNLILIYCERHNLSESRVRVYKVLASQLKRFELYVQYTVNPYFRLNYNTMSNDDIEEFRVYLKTEYKLVETYPKIYKKIFAVATQAEGDRFKKNKISERSSNYISGILKKLASVFHWLQEIGRTTNDPFKGVDFGKVLYGRPIYINKEERDIIANFDLTSKDTVLQQQRDIFVFQCLVGCRVGDLLRLTKANITGESGNVLYLFIDKRVYQWLYFRNINPYSVPKLFRIYAVVVMNKNVTHFLHYIPWHFWMIGSVLFCQFISSFSNDFNQFYKTIVCNRIC